MTMSVAGAAALALLLTVVSSSEGSPVCKPVQLQETLEMQTVSDRPDSTDSTDSESEAGSTSEEESKSSSSSSTFDSDLADL